MASASTSTIPSDNDLCRQWIECSDDNLTADLVQQTLDQIPDNVWVTAACLDRLLEDATLQKPLLELGLKRTEPAVQRTRTVYESYSEADDEEHEGGRPHGTEDERRRGALASYFRDEPADAELCAMRAVLLDRLDRLNTFVEVAKDAVPQQDSEVDDDWADDPWADTTDAAPGPSQSQAPPPIGLPEFLTTSLVDNACFLASQGHYTAVSVMLRRHGQHLWPYRFTILENISEHALAADYRDLLPRLSSSEGLEEKSDPEPWRSEPDWAEETPCCEAIRESGIPVDVQVPEDLSEYSQHTSPLDASSLAAWYERRIDYINSATGMVDSALSLVQHAVSQGVQGLDEIAEDLLLLSRLVYDVPHPEDTAAEADWTLSWWRSLDPSAAVNAFMSQTTPETVARQIQKVLNPYLFVLEARAERKGEPDPDVANRLLRNFILRAPLEIVAGILEASKPTLPPAQRLIRDDEDMARLALSCLYGSESVDEWATMSRIFECLPAWEIQDADGDEADTTVSSLAEFVIPSTSHPTCSPSDIYLFFKPLPLTSLSRALDLLDVHLESGEILARWGAPAPLRWFLHSYSREAEQEAWANRVARRAGGSVYHIESQDDWEWLLEDMLKLSGSGDGRLKGAFCLLSKEKICRIYLSGLLSSGAFDVARDLLRHHRHKLDLDASAVEEICLASSQEFYDNASSGNYHFGDMKSAYECLDVPPPSKRIVEQKEFIEATSRLCSFNLMSRPGIPITPIEIRLTKDRLSLVSRVLSSNSEAYKHTQVILELVQKLGFRNDIVAEVKTLAMLAETALNVEDFERAYEINERMVKTLLDLRASRSEDDPEVNQANEVCWVSCYQLGRHPEFEDTQRKAQLIGRALELCPPDTLADVLASWSRLEKEDIERRQEKRETGRARKSAGRQSKPPGSVVAASLASRLQSLNMHIPGSPLPHAPDAAALANKALHSVAANLPFGARGRSLFSQSGDRSRSSSRYDGAEVQAQASRVLQKGLGWLLGDDE